MATHSRILAWKTPQTEERCSRLQPMRLQRVRHNLGTKQRQQLVRKHQPYTCKERVVVTFPMWLSYYLHCPLGALGWISEMVLRQWTNYICWSKLFYYWFIVTAAKGNNPLGNSPLGNNTDFSRNKHGIHRKPGMRHRNRNQVLLRKQ